MKTMKLLLAMLALCGLARPSAASTLTVSTLADSGVGSLRTAIDESAANDTIIFSNTLSGQTIVLTSGQLEVTKNLVINASALPGGVAINGNGASRIFDFASFTTNILAGLTLTNGQVDGGSGGAIYLNSNAVLTVSNSTVSGNAGGIGGGIYSEYGTLTLSDCTLSGNTAYYDGGGIYSSSFSTLTLSNCTLSRNLAFRDGGGIYSYYDTLTLSDCTLSRNWAGFPNASGGGGIASLGSTLTLSDCTLSGNTAYYDGGGIYSSTFSSTLSNCTLSGNEANLGAGAGIYNDLGGALRLNNTTVSGNGVEHPTCGIYNKNNNDSNFTLTNSIVAGNGGPNIGGNGFSGVNNLTSGDPLLAPLGDYGGATQTMPPLPGSPAIDQGGPTSRATDQRGMPRPVDLPSYPNASGGYGCDIGAVEVQFFPVDINLRAYDGANIIHIACEPPGAGGQLTSPLRIRKGTMTYGVVLVNPSAPDASNLKIMTATGLRALAKLP